MEWGILFNPDGTPVGKQNEFGARLYLLYRVLEAGRSECTPGLLCGTVQREYADDVNKWDFAMVTMSFVEKRIWVLGDRERPCPDCQPRTPEPTAPEVR